MKYLTKSQYKIDDVLMVTHAAYGFAYAQCVKVIDPNKTRDKHKNYCILVADIATGRSGLIPTKYVAYTK